VGDLDDDDDVYDERSPQADDDLSPSKTNKRKGISDEDPQKVFTILSKIGEGAYGSVFKARDNRSSAGELVAVKVLKLDRKNIKNLRQEIRVLQQCNSPSIVAYKGTFRQKNNVWICMEYCDSGSLSDMLEECRMTLTEEQVAAVMKMALQGLEYIHSIKKIHRDLKAANILVNTQGDCKLADFGVSAEMKNTLARRNTAIGTPHWMAPEVINSNMKYNTKADVWSLGITAYELACGEPPHSNVNQMRAIFLIPTAPAPQLPHPERWSRKFKDFLNLCLQKNPDLRPDASTLLREHPFITQAGGKQVIAELVRECEAKRAKKKRDNLKTLQERLQTEHGPEGIEDGEGDVGVRRPTELGEGEPDFEPVRNRTKPLQDTAQAPIDSGFVEYPQTGGEDEDLIQIMYS
jgi:serine/threonine kinase 3